MKCLCNDSKRGAGIIIALMSPVWILAINHAEGQPASSSDEQTRLVDSGSAQPANDKQTQEKNMVSKEAVSSEVLGYTIEMIDGSKQDLEQYRGKVVMMVNVASECGLTPQYEALEALYRERKDDGLVIIGFPANDFAGQEPGTNKEIARFCSTRYDVTFPLAAKIHVKGEEAHPLYKQLAAQPQPVGGEPEWNFDKFIVDRNGDVVARFKPRTTPEDPALVARLEELLGADS